LVKFLDLLLWHPVLIFVLGILGFVEKGAVPLVRQLGKRWLFSAFLALMSCPLQAEALN
jgi:hypothetical protein